jgi:hypothetical protein
MSSALARPIRTHAGGSTVVTDMQSGRLPFVVLETQVAMRRRGGRAIRWLGALQADVFAEHDATRAMPIDRSFDVLSSPAQRCQRRRSTEVSM